MNRAVLAFATSFAMLLGRPALAEPSPFDLSGPSLRVSVTRQGHTLPIGAVPQLAAGDRLSIEARLPADETVRYLMVTAFLRDPTNPPPDGWFQQSQTWHHPGHGGGPIVVTVPVGAQHLVLFLAPATGGGFATLRAAVAARPGAFVRAAQDLEQASLDRSRYEAFLTAIRKAATTAPDALVHVAPLVASSLRIKINDDCLQRQPELQGACLLDAKQSVVLGNGDDSAGTLSAAATDLALTLSATPAGGLGYYSPYISAVREIIGIFSAMHTARYQYIPALTVPSSDGVALVLNTPPSFANPKSVLMAALPAVTASHAPTLAVLTGAPVPCLGAREAVLPVVVGPLFYATAYAHDLMLRVNLPETNARLDLPLVADAMRGGLVIGLLPSIPAGLTGMLSATVTGMWGFEPFTGPVVSLQAAGDWRWQARANGKGDGQLLFTGGTAACVSTVVATPAHGIAQPASWKVSDVREIAVSLPATDEKRQLVTLRIVGPAGTAPAEVTVMAPAKTPPPSALIIAHSSELARPDQQGLAAVILDSPDEIPADVPLSFTLKASDSQLFSGREAVEIGTTEGDGTVKLTLGNGLVRVDAGVMVASLNPAQGLGSSAFGPMRARLVRGGVVGEWLNLGTLVRLPRLKQLTCPARSTVACTLTGNGLYLLASVSATRDFDNATSVAEGYPGFTLAVPHPAIKDGLFVRLHDAPEVINHMAVDATAGSK